MVKRTGKITNLNELSQELNDLINRVDWDNFKYSDDPIFDSKQGKSHAPNADALVDELNKTTNRFMRELKKQKSNWLQRETLKQFQLMYAQSPEVKASVEKFVLANSDSGHSTDEVKNVHPEGPTDNNINNLVSPPLDDLVG